MYPVVVRYDGPLPAEAKREMADVIKSSLRPADVKSLLGELAKADATLINRRQDDIDRELRMQVMAEELLEFPADVAMSALRDWRRAEKFFPTIAELRPAMERWRHQRKARLRALERLA